jgi:hypothetical protein
MKIGGGPFSKPGLGFIEKTIESPGCLRLPVDGLFWKLRGWCF